MAMNKKERALVEGLKEELRVAKALRFTDPVEPDVQPQQGQMTKGWLFNSYLSNPRVYVACSTSISHGIERDDKADTQGARTLFSSKLLALRALRSSVEKSVAKILADIDAEIELESHE